MKTHRHERTSWLIAGGYIEWCYVCGAWRSMRRVAPTGFTPAHKGWYKPSGDAKLNPAYRPLKKTQEEV